MTLAQKFVDWFPFFEDEIMTSKLGPTLLPALKGQIGRWAFYTTVMKFSEVVERIRMSKEIYQNKRFSDMVQRSVKSERAEKIAEYLKSEEERFFPAMVVAVYEGEPNWLEFSIEKGSAEVDVDLSALWTGQSLTPSAFWS